jgi:hypothetical protein
MSKVPGTYASEHSWVIVGTFEIALDEHEARRIAAGELADVAVPMDRARPVKVTGPGCERCGQHVSVAAGSRCPGRVAETVLEEIAARDAARAARDQIWTPPA